MQDVAVADCVIPALELHLAGVLAPLLTAIGDKIIVGLDFGANETLGEVRVNDPRRRDRRSAAVHSPGAGFLFARGEEGDQVE